jgi:hypothetical protein
MKFTKKPDFDLDKIDIHNEEDWEKFSNWFVESNPEFARCIWNIIRASRKSQIKKDIQIVIKTFNESPYEDWWLDVLKDDISDALQNQDESWSIE